MAEAQPPPVVVVQANKAETDDEYYAIMNKPGYRPPVETKPTPNRSDSFHSLMTKATAEKVFAKYDKNTTMADLYGDRVTEIEKEIRENPTFGTTPQREQILNASTEQIRDYRIEEAYQLRKSRMFWCCFISNFFGLTLTFYSLSLTVIFEKYDPDQTLFIVSFIFYVPAVVWFVYVYLPCKTERERRKKMHGQIRIRKHLQRVRDSYFYGHEDSDEEEFAQFEKQQAREQRKNNRGSGSFATKDSNRKSTVNNTTSSAKDGRTSITRQSVELPKAPARSSIKKATASEKKASVQFKV